MRKFRGIICAAMLVLATIAVSLPVFVAEASSESPDGETKLVTVQFKNVEPAVSGAGQESSAERAKIAEAQNQVDQQVNRAVGYTKLVHKYQNLPMAVYEVDGVGEKTLRANPNILSVAESRVLESMEVLTSPITTIGGTPANGFVDSNTSTVYDGTGYSVAVLDTGVDKTHPFLSGKVIHEACYGVNGQVALMVSAESLCGNTTVQYPQIDKSTAAGSAAPCSLSGCYHGTGVAGISSMNKSNPTDPSLTGNTITLRGTASGSKVIAMQVLSKINGVMVCGVSSNPCVRSLSPVYMAALDDLLTLATNPPSGNKIAAVNMSLGGGAYANTAECVDTTGYDQMATAIAALKAKGVAVVIAAGNDGEDDKNAIAQPACVEGAVAVAASTIDGTSIASYSQNNDLVSLIAPGGDIQYNSSNIVTDPALCEAWYKAQMSQCPRINMNTAYISTDVGGGVQYMQGTSMATPVVTGAFATLRQKYPNLSVDELLGILQTTGTPLRDNRAGYTFDDDPSVEPKRLINLGAALSINDGTPSRPKPSISNFAGPTTLVNEGSNITITADVAHADSCALSNDIGNVPITNGKVVTSVPAFASYVLTCANSEDSTAETLTLVNFNSRPTQPGSPDITNIDKNSGGLTVKWTASSDSDGVVQYRVFVDGALVAEVDGDTLQVRIADVDFSRDHTITVVAVDVYGAVSLPGVFSFRTQDIDGIDDADESYIEQGGPAQEGGARVAGAPNTALMLTLSSPWVILAVGIVLATVIASRRKFFKR